MKLNKIFVILIIILSFSISSFLIYQYENEIFKQFIVFWFILIIGNYK